MTMFFNISYLRFKLDKIKLQSELLNEHVHTVIQYIHKENKYSYHKNENTHILQIVPQALNLIC